MAPQENNSYPIFTGVFLVDPVPKDQGISWKLSKFHITYHFDPGGPIFPDEVMQGDFVKIEHIGIYEDADVLTSQVALHTPIGRFTRQLDGSTPLHITWDSGEHPPILAGQRLRDLTDEYGTDCGEIIHSDMRYNPINEVYEKGFEWNDDKTRNKYTHIMKKLLPIGMWYTKCGPQRKPE